MGWLLLAEVVGLLAALALAVPALQSTGDGKNSSPVAAVTGILPLFALLYGGSLILFLAQTYLYPLITAAWLKASVLLFIYAGISVAETFLLTDMICRLKNTKLPHKTITVIAVTLSLFIGYYLLGNFLPSPP